MAKDYMGGKKDEKMEKKEARKSGHRKSGGRKTAAKD